jgi:transposase
MQPSAYQHVVGVDIAAATFTAGWLEHQRPSTFAQTADGFAEVCQQLLAAGLSPHQTLVVMEATGSYWVALAVAPHAAGFHVSVVNPKLIHHYAKSLPRRSKTDALDTSVLRQFGLECQPPRWTPPPTVYHGLRQRLVARDAVAEMRQQARNQLHALQQWPVVVDKVLHQFQAIEADLAGRIAA